MNFENIFYDLAFINGGRFANIDNFCKSIINEMSLLKCSNIEQVYQNVNMYINFDTIGLSVTKENALRIVLSDDVRKFDIKNYQIFPPEYLYEMLLKYANEVIGFFQSMGLHIDNNEIDLFFCDVFPKPFENVKGNAISSDYYDYQKYGIKQGIYFLKSSLSYYQSKLLIAHEILHRICSKKNPELLARGLEEGLCEFIGSLLANTHFFDDTIVYNYIRYRRLKYENKSQKFRIYTDYMRLAYRLYLYIGLDGIVGIINTGRKKIKEIETLLLSRDIDEISPNFSLNIDRNINRLAGRLLLGTIENETLSPLAYYIIYKYNNETSTMEFASMNNINIDDCTHAFQEIQDRIFGCVLDNETIEFSDIAQIRQNSNLYYECKE